MKIYIDDRQDKIKLDKDIIILMEKAIYQSLKVEGRNEKYEISVSFVDNEEIRELNKNYRGIDSITDVLSFPMEEDFGVGIAFLGDIIISTEKAMEQSNDYGHTLEREIIYLTVHSMLHLMGYDHLNEADEELMRSKEKTVMKTLGIFKANKGE